MNYVIANSKNWFDISEKSKKFNELSFFHIKTKEELNLEYLSKIKPKYIFFPHWNWKVNKEIFENYECVAFHTAPLPYGRGGSPIQNLIIRGFKQSPISALKMNEVLDGGPIYIQENINLDGNIDQIFSRISEKVEKMILEICKNNLIPKEQIGKPFLFKRLTKKDNEINPFMKISDIYDRIRMVDGQDYEKSYINFGRYKIYLSDAQLLNNKVEARISITLDDETNNNY